MERSDKGPQVRRSEQTSVVRVSFFGTRDQKYSKFLECWVKIDVLVLGRFRVLPYFFFMTSYPVFAKGSTRAGAEQCGG